MTENENILDTEKALTEDWEVPKSDHRDSGQAEFTFNESAWDAITSEDDLQKFLPTQPQGKTGIRPPLDSALTAVDVMGNSGSMADLLSRLNETSDYQAETVINSPEIAKPLRKTMIAESRSNREWQIRLTETTGSKSLYNVVNASAKKCFFNDLYLQQSAKNLCQLLERGEAINSPKISSVLYYEEIYRKNYEEMRSLKKHYATAKANKSIKTSILESKFHKAKDNAKAAADKQKRLL